MTGVKMMNDFRVSSNGHCFFCLNPILQLKTGPNQSSPLATQINSLQYLTRYLKMDLRKVFIDKRQASPELLAKVEKAKLQVELCEECRYLNEKLSDVYRQLEKLELELGSILGVIHGKLVGADATDKLRCLNSNWNGLLEVLDVLRAEAFQKGSAKLADTPRVKIQKLSRREIKAKQFRFENTFKTTQLPTSANYTSNLIERGCDKMESFSEKNSSDDDTGNYFSGHVDSNEGGECMEDEDTRPVKIEINVTENDSIVAGLKGNIGDKQLVSRTIRKKLAGKCSVNPKTEARKCNACQVEFSNQGTFNYHYRTVHLKLRYKCVSCNKLFAHGASLRLHQRTSQSCSKPESAPKFNCHLCGKSCTLKQSLQRHLDAVHYKLQKYKCDLCGKKYNTMTCLTRHQRTVHAGENYNN